MQDVVGPLPPSWRTSTTTLKDMCRYVGGIVRLRWRTCTLTLEDLYAYVGGLGRPRWRNCAPTLEDLYAHVGGIVRSRLRTSTPMLDDFAVHAGGIEFSCCGPWIFGLWNIGKEVDLQRRLCATGRIRLFRFSAGHWRIWDPFEGKNCIARLDFEATWLVAKARDRTNDKPIHDNRPP